MTPARTVLSPGGRIVANTYTTWTRIGHLVVQVLLGPRPPAASRREWFFAALRRCRLSVHLIEGFGPALYRPDGIGAVRAISQLSAPRNAGYAPWPVADWILSARRDRSLELSPREMPEFTVATPVEGLAVALGATPLWIGRLDRPWPFASARGMRGPEAYRLDWPQGFVDPFRLPWWELSEDTRAFLANPRRHAGYSQGFTTMADGRVLAGARWPLEEEDHA